jgi:hypothetical protein
LCEPHMRIILIHDPPTEFGSLGAAQPSIPLSIAW